MKLINKLTFFLFIMLGIVYRAQSTPPQPPIVGRPADVGPGTPASPIDMYVYILAAGALIFIYYYHCKTTKKII